MKNLSLFFLLMLGMISCKQTNQPPAETEEGTTFHPVFECMNPEVNEYANVNFRYDISGIEDSVFFNHGFDKKLHYLDKNKKTASFLYHKVGFYHATIRTRYEILDTAKVLVISDPVYCGVSSTKYGYNPIDIQLCKKDGAFFIEPQLLKTYERFVNDYWGDLKIYKNFNLSGDNFILETEVKSDPAKGGQGCCDIVIGVDGEHNDIWPYFVKEGCESSVLLRISEKDYKSSNSDVSAFVKTMKTFHRVKIVNRNKHVQFYLNDKLIFDKTYNQSLGMIYGLDYSFYGSGVVNSVSLSDTSGNIVFFEDFN